MIRARAFLGSTRAATAAEFALVLPVLLIFIFAIIDGARYVWTYNRAEKATQIGVRFAVVTDVVATELDDDFALTRGVPGGQAVDQSVFFSTTCTNTSCTPDWGHDAEAFARIRTRVQNVYGPINANNLRVRYDNVGLGYAGDPSAPDVSALVTVELQNLTFQPVTFIVFGGSLTLPTIRASMTLEDGSRNGV